MDVGSSLVDGRLGLPQMWTVKDIGDFLELFLFDGLFGRLDCLDSTTEERPIPWEYRRIVGAVLEQNPLRIVAEDDGGRRVWPPMKHPV